MNIYTPKPTTPTVNKKSNIRYVTAGIVVGIIFWSVLALSIAAFG